MALWSNMYRMKHIYGQCNGRLVDAFAVLADPTRRQILGLLREHEHSVGQLVDQVDMHQPGVSRHLRVLHEAGLVTIRKEAQKRVYSIQPAPLREVDLWLGEFRILWEARFDRLSAHVKKMESRKPR